MTQAIQSGGRPSAVQSLRTWVTASYLANWASSLLFFAGFYGLVASLPTYLANDCRLTDWQLGTLVGAFGMAAPALRPMSGSLVDRWGPGPAMVAGAAALALGSAAVTLTSRPDLLLALRIVQAFGYASFTTASVARAVAMVPPGRRGAALALLGTAASVAVAVTPFAIAFVAGPARAGPLLASAALIAGAGLASLAIAGRRPRAGPTAAYGGFRPARGLRGPMAAAFCLGVGFGAFLQFLPLLEGRRGIRPAGVGYAAYGATIILTRLSVACGSRPTSLSQGRGLAFLASSAGLCVLAAATNVGSVALGAALVAAGSGVLHPGLIDECVGRLAPDRSGQAVASFYLAFDLGIGGGAWLITPALRHAGVGGAYLAAAALTACGALAGAGGLARSNVDSALQKHPDCRLRASCDAMDHQDVCRQSSPAVLSKQAADLNPRGGPGTPNVASNPLDATNVVAGDFERGT